MRRATTGTARWQKTIGVVGLVAVLWAGNNLYDAISSGGRGPGGGPGGHETPSGAPPAEPTDEDDQAPPGGGEGGHDPSQFDHSSP